MTRVPRTLLAAMLLALSTQPLFAQNTAIPQINGVRLFSWDSVNVQAAHASPDGKWLAFAREDSESTASLWIVPIKGGTPTQLTSSGFWDQGPRWFPSGDRILFISSRPARGSENFRYAMLLNIDPATGRASGPPRQVTIDPVAREARLSPDGVWVVYADARKNTRVKVIPATGGNARLLTEAPSVPANLTWSEDGKQVLFTVSNRAEGFHRIMSVPTAGGKAVELARTRKLLRGVGATGRYFVADSNYAGRGRQLQIVDAQARVLAAIPTTDDMGVVSFTKDDRAVIGVESRRVAPTRVVAVAGGAYQEVMPPTSYDWPMGWNDNSVHTATTVGGRRVLGTVNMNGGQMRTFVPPEGVQAEIEAANGNYLIYSMKPNGDLAKIVMVELNSGRQRVLTERVFRSASFYALAPGGMFMNGEEALYIERDGDTFKLYSAPFTGSRRLLRSFPANLLGKTNIAVHGNRVAWARPDKSGGVDLVIAEGPTAAPRRLLSAHSFGDELTFSPDGRWISTHYRPTADSPDEDMAIVDTRAFDATAPARVLKTGTSYWYWPRWLPDNSAVLVIGGTGAGSQSDVLMLPLREGQPPVNITRDDPSPKWGFELSPDGRYIAYPGEVWQGSAIWRFDLGELSRK